MHACHNGKAGWRRGRTIGFPWTTLGCMASIMTTRRYAAIAVAAVLTACSSGKPTPTPDEVVAAPNTTSSSVAVSTTAAESSTTTLLREAGVRRVEAPGSDITIRFDADVAPELVAMLTETFPVARAEPGDSGPLAVYVYGDPNNFVDEYSRVTGQSVDRVRAGLPNRGIEARSGSIWYYVPNSKTYGRLSVLHEYSHTVQYRLAGDKDVSASRSRSSPLFHPLWLSEGTSDYLMYKVGSSKGYSQSFERTRQSRIQAAKQYPQPLGDLESRTGGPSAGGTNANDSAGYAWGFVAADYLASKYGLTSIQKNYWEALADKGWQSAFESTFGLTVDVFYEQFAVYRATL